jgi:hypothetical protein
MTLFAGLTYGQEVTDKYYQYDLTLDQYHSMPVAIDMGNGPYNTTYNFLDKNKTVTRNLIYNTSRFDPNTPYVLIETKYKIRDIVEFPGLSTVYVLADRKDKIVKTYSYDEYNSLDDHMREVGGRIKHTSALDSAGQNLIDSYGVANGLGKEVKSTVLLSRNILVKDQIRPFFNPDMDMDVDCYGLSIGNVLKDKYTGDLRNIQKDHPAFCEFVKNNKVTYDKEYSYLEKIQKFSDYYGADYSMRLTNFGSLEFVSKDDITFENREEYNKYLKDNNLTTNYNYYIFDNLVFRIFKSIRIDGDEKVTSESAILEEYTAATNKNLINAFSSVIDNTGFRVIIGGESGYQFTYLRPIQLKAKRKSAEEAITALPTNMYFDEEEYYNVTGLVRVGDSVFFSQDVNKYPERVERNIKLILDKLNEEELSYLGIYKRPLLSPATTSIDTFSDLTVGRYISDKNYLWINGSSDSFAHFTKIKITDYSLMRSSLLLSTNTNRDIANHKSIYTYFGGMMIESHPWGFLLVNPNDDVKYRTYYKLPFSVVYNFNPFNNLVKDSNTENESYWNLKNYYKGDITLSTKTNGIDSVIKYKLLEGNNNFTVDDNIVFHKARKLDDNSIVTIELIFEEDRITVSSY